MSAESFQSVPTFSHTTRYLPVTSCGVGPGATTRQAYNSPPAARALTNDPVATSISYLFFIRVVCLLGMPPDIAGPHPWPDKFVPGDFRDGFDQLPFVYGDPLTNQLDGSFLIRFVCKEIPHHSRFSLGIESRDPDVSC
jgi:hypothetical protein